MVSPEQIYPELSADEVRELTGPLAVCDADVEAFLQQVSVGPSSVDDTTLAAWVAEAEQYPFQRLVRGAVIPHAATFARRMPTGGLDDPTGILRAFAETLEPRLRELLVRPLVVAVNGARRAGTLHGDTPAARYDDFIRRAARDGHEALGGVPFALLPSLVEAVGGNAVDAWLELLDRLGADRPDLQVGLGIAIDDPVERIDATGDTHAHGRAVAILRFVSGRRLVYKPRSVSCEAAYARLAEGLRQDFDADLSAARVLDRGRYGYMEFIESEDVGAVARDFFRRSGELAAVFFLLGARDMHFENLVATRRGPVPVDLETILHPRRIHVGPVAEAPDGAYATIAASIYGIGILPLVMVGKDRDAGHVDLGFLGGSGAGTSPFKSLAWTAPFTDEIAVRLQHAAAPQRHAVTGGLDEPEVRELGDRMAEGFARLVRRVSADPERWIALLTDACAGVRVRYVHNPTALYAQTLRMAAGPRAVGSLDVQLALLKRIGIASEASDPRIVRSEIRQLAERDVPYFSVAADGVELTDADGDPVGPTFETSSLADAVQRARSLDERELERQLTLLHSAFAARFPDNHLGDERPAPDPGRAAGKDGLADVTRHLCDRLVDTALPDRFAHLPATWIGPLASADADRPWPPGVLGYDLYTGRTGPALALAAAGRVLDEPRYVALADQIFGTAADILAQQTFERRSIEKSGYGAYTGLAGLLFALSCAGRILGRDEWIETAQAAVPLVTRQLPQAGEAGRAIDVIGGDAGVLLCLLEIGGEQGRAAGAALARELATAVTAPHTPVADAALAQSGFAHGSAGLLFALSRAAMLGDRGDRARLAPARARLMEQLTRMYEPTEGTWRSRIDPDSSRSTGWCHGATGVALALDAHDRADRGALDGLRAQAVRSVCRDGFGRNLTWCHGDLGSHDALLALADRGDETARAHAEEVAATWLQPATITARTGARHSRYAHTTSAMVGSSGVVIHLVNRLTDAWRLSPTRLTLSDDSAREVHA